MLNRRLFTLLCCSLVLAVPFLALVPSAFGLPDCDGSQPKSAPCGDPQGCGDPQQNPLDGSWYCPQDLIEQQFAQYLCESGDSTSTKCAETEERVVCTKRYDCVLVEQTEGGVTTRTCQSTGTGVDNSFKYKTDYIECQDGTPFP